MEDCERDCKEAIYPPFLRGVSSILSLLELTVSAGTGDLSEADSKQFKIEIESAQREILSAEEAASRIVDGIDTSCEKLMVQHGKLSTEQKELQKCLKCTQDQLAEVQDQRKRIEVQLQAAAVSLKQMEQTLKGSRAKKGEKQTGRDIGIGLSFVIPCIGIPMAVAFEKERLYRKSEVDIALEDLSHVKANITKDEEEMEKLNSQFPELEKKREETAESLSVVKAELLKIKRSRGALANVQCKLKRCHQHLSALHGRVSALKAQAQHMYSMVPLIPFVRETCAQAQLQGPGTELLMTGSQIHKVIEGVRIMLPKLQEPNLSDIASYM
ncbi:uncharacterized protein LOC125454989 [Stegostoma tigrinum]|uniref:uncharacterized protein LOC125454989 n=1 Tax=Stegostoma tigrinum TaxID=3053191 RepID=UPI00202ACE98|nr:uncharacterized protein LOC125454989 [Stegostoma tigrinum]XP_059504745.1 uncharacterized protein LOC125454989 [Stegostoma tigrinum]XP_059504746.1 uncharacterized protein LOC125454989 [Stegostoma tigrinum]XP_059504747.1 uncharacterized protein LOC125454989 [Stegostoma tigrinum]XP_059504748.1 uncharacterized protein LOC125454989 [Stegostoma tigrinum]XP_059504749.1 uncharacterized protein LOC125454989 [Stegostoma tigrinum]XP_059504750.1 uncharacterized protein LOC125454989 [Stegostoma tigrinu